MMSPKKDTKAKGEKNTTAPKKVMAIAKKPVTAQPVTKPVADKPMTKSDMAKPVVKPEVGRPAKKPALSLWPTRPKK